MDSARHRYLDMSVTVLLECCDAADPNAWKNMLLPWLQCFGPKCKQALHGCMRFMIAHTQKRERGLHLLHTPMPGMRVQRAMHSIALPAAFQLLTCTFASTAPSSAAQMADRLTYRRRHPYATRSNKTRVVKTPGETPDLAACWLRDRLMLTAAPVTQCWPPAATIRRVTALHTALRCSAVQVDAM